MEAKELRDRMQELAGATDNEHARDDADRLIVDYLEQLARGQLDGDAERYVLEAVKVYREHRGNVAAS